MLHQPLSSKCLDSRMNHYVPMHCVFDGGAHDVVTTKVQALLEAHSRPGIGSCNRQCTNLRPGAAVSTQYS